MNTDLMRDIEKFVEENRAAIVRDIARLVAVNSVEGEAAGANAPFGEGPRKALDEALKISEELGLEAVDCEGYIGYAKLGEADKYIATITHLDVVPVGDGWNTDPFTLRERDGYIIGRGVMDDKGPSVLCLYALKYLKERGVKLNYELRALLGANEETGMKDVDYYLENYPAPVFCFSPDGNFPVCNGEKGICHGKIISTAALENIVDIHGGFAANAIPDSAYATVRYDGELSDAEWVKAEKDGELWKLTAHGIGGHAAMAEGTVNAIGKLVEYILANNIAGVGERAYFELISKLHESYDGSALGVDADDGLFAPLTIAGGVIGIEDGKIFQTIDSRYPTNTSGKQIGETITALAAGAAVCEMGHDAAPFYMSLDNAAVKVCIDTYNEVTGEQAKPFTMGGGTYARHFPNAVSFGPDRVGEARPDFAGPIHGVNEAADFNGLLDALKMYILTLIRLQDAEL